MKSTQLLREEYQEYIRSFGTVFQRCIKIGNTNPLHIIVQSKWNNERTRQATEYFDWPEIDIPFVYHEQLNNLCTLYGSILSISPSGQYGLLGKLTETKEGWSIMLVNFDKMQIVNHFVLPLSSFNTPLSCIQWNEEYMKLSVSYGDENESLGLNERRSSWMVDSHVYHFSLYLVSLLTNIVEKLQTCINDFSYGPHVWKDNTTIYSIGWKQTPHHEVLNPYVTLPTSLICHCLESNTFEVIQLPINPQFIRYNDKYDQIIVIGPSKDVLSYNSTMQIISVKASTHSYQVLIDQQNQSSPSGFIGISSPTLQDYPFSTDGEYPSHLS